MLLLCFVVAQQLNSSECNCAPNDCEQTDIAFEQLKNSTDSCFEDYNIPLNTVASKIRRDTEKLRKAVENLLEVNPRSHTTEDYSFDYKQIESQVMVKTFKQTIKGNIAENQWCFY